MVYRIVACEFNQICDAEVQLFACGLMKMSIAGTTPFGHKQP